jgi:hypothetical protein
MIRFICSSSILKLYLNHILFQKQPLHAVQFASVFIQLHLDISR